MKRLSIGHIMAGIIAVIATLLTAQAVLSGFVSTKVQSSIDQEQALATATEALKDARYHMVQIQQYLTDVSVTGDHSGFEAAAEHLQQVEQRVNAMAAHYPAAAAFTKQILHDARVMHESGVRMTHTYLEQGQAAGNALMKDPTSGFDVATERLTGQLESIIGRLQHERDIGKDALHDAADRMRLVVIGSSLACAVLVAVLLLLLYRMVVPPMRTLSGAMAHCAHGDLVTRVDTRGLMEFHTLASLFNTMAQRVTDLIDHERKVAEDIQGKVQQILDVVARAAKGDLTVKMMAHRGNDVIAALAEGIQSMLDSLSALVAQVQQSGIQVTSAATEIASTAMQQEATVTEQAFTTNEIKATVTEISATAKELVNTMNEVTDVAMQTSESAGEGQQSLQRMESTMHQMMEATAAINAKLAVLNEKAGNINTVITTITKVADQTNLLSLNAAIEAEKAGEYGVGFSVVATEIRRLADQTAVATWDIEQMVREMQSAVSSGVMGMDKFTEEVRRGVSDVRQVGTHLGKIIEQVQALPPRIETVHEGMQSQAQGGLQISEAMKQLSETAQQTAESLRMSNTAIQQLNQAANGMQESVSRFKIN